MRLPFIQLESDLIAHSAPEVAALAGCSVPVAIGHIAMVRAWAVSMADDAAPPDGWIAGEAAGRRVEAAAQWTGDRGRLLQALKDAGQVRDEPGGIRVLHLEPYVKAWEQNAKSKERMRTLRERSANTPERPAKFEGQTQTQTQTQKESNDPPPSASGGQGELLPDVPPTPPAKPAKKAREAKKSEPPPDPKPYTAACDMLTRVYSEVRNADYGFSLNATRNGKAVRELLWGDGAKGQERGDPLVPLDELERRWRIGLAWKGFPTCSAIWDLKDNWAAYGQPQQESARAPQVLDVRRGGVRAELMDHTRPQEPF